MTVSMSQSAWWTWDAPNSPSIRSHISRGKFQTLPRALSERQQARPGQMMQRCQANRMQTACPFVRVTAMQSTQLRPDPRVLSAGCPVPVFPDWVPRARHKWLGASGLAWLFFSRATCFRGWMSSRNLADMITSSSDLKPSLTAFIASHKRNRVARSCK